MNKKNTNWITIPENKIHTPVSNTSAPKKRTNQSVNSVQNKIFWGVGFVALIIISFAALAPTEFNSIIKGDLFDAQGSPESPGINLLPTPQGSTPFDTDQSAADSASDLAGQGSADSQPEGNQNINTVQPEAEAVTIAVEPIAPTACGSDIQCFVSRLENCDMARADFDYLLGDQSVRLALEITGSNLNDCQLEIGFAEGPDSSVEGSVANCRIEKSSDYTSVNLENWFSDPSWFASQCTGQAVSLMASYFDGLEVAKATSAQNQLIEELTAKLEALEQQQANDQQVITDLQNNGLRPSAPENTVPSSVTSTTAIGQPPAQIPGFRTNPYAVNATPQQVLQQNLNSGVQLSQANTTGSYAQANQVYTGSSAIQNQPLSGGTTPESGPAEMMILAVLLTYASFLGWKFIRHRRA